MYKNILDARGLACPKPMLMLKKYMAEQIKVGETVTLLTTDRNTAADANAFCHQTRHELLKSERVGTEYIILITKGE